MKRQMYLPVAALLLSLSYVALSADPGNRPAGVAAENWVAVSDRLGIVLVGSGDAAKSAERLVPVEVRGTPGNAPRGQAVTVQSSQALLLKPPSGGYFMVKGASGWTRLVVIEPIKGPADVG
jgi:hypothetical protein